MRWLIVLLIVILGGCAHKPQPLPVQSVAVVFKSPSFKVAGSGFLQKGRRLQLYSASTPLLDLRLGKRVCLNGRCISYEMFNKKILSSSYPLTLIKNILSFRPIFSGQNRTTITGGFEQRFDNLGIIYKIYKKTLLFKDTKHHILIKIKEIDG